MKRLVTAFSVLLCAILFAATVGAQGRPASPRGQAATELSGSWSSEGRPQYQGGKWLEIDYGRPLLRQRENIFGAGESYGKGVLAGAPVWRMGANPSTRLKTEVDLVIGGTKVPAGEYSLFIDLKGPTDWTLIVSNWAAQQNFDRNNKDALWGAYGYTADKDLVRAAMTVQAIDLRVDELTIGFINVTGEGGTLALWWDKTMASVPFTVAK